MPGVLHTASLLGRLESLGERLRSELQDLFAEMKIPAQATGLLSKGAKLMLRLIDSRLFIRR